MGVGTRSDLTEAAVRALGTAVQGAIRAVLGALLLFIVVVLRLTKPIVYYPLALATVGAVGVSVVFAVAGRWNDVLQAAVAAVVAIIVLGMYTAAAEWVDPGFFQPSRQPPWWWFV